MKALIFMLTAILYCSLLCAQTDTTITDTTRSVYKALPVIRYYPANRATPPSDDKETISINSVLVRKSAYTTMQPLNAITACKPCILLSYNKEGRLLSKSINYTDAIVGYYIEYHPNGKAKLIGHYKENPTGDWNDLWNRGYARKDGVFTYFDERGIKLYSEYWKNDEFVKQVPEQSKAEIWTVDVTLHNEKLPSPTITITPLQLKEIKITPRYKNKSTAGNLFIKVDVFAPWQHMVSDTFTLDNFKDIDIQKMVNKARVKEEDHLLCDIYIFNNGNLLYFRELKLQPVN